MEGAREERVPMQDGPEGKIVGVFGEITHTLDYANLLLHLGRASEESKKPKGKKTSKKRPAAAPAKKKTAKKKRRKPSEKEIDEDEEEDEEEEEESGEIDEEDEESEAVPEAVAVCEKVAEGGQPPEPAPTGGGDGLSQDERGLNRQEFICT